MRNRRVALVAWLLLVAVCLGAGDVLASWSLSRQAQMANQERNTLRFSWANDGPMRIWLLLRKNEKGAFANSTMYYQVDDNPVRTVDEMARVQIREGRWIYWQPDCKAEACLGHLVVSEFMKGKEVVFQYHFSDGRIKETAFPLDGLRLALTRLWRP